MRRALHFLFWIALPGAALGYVLYRAIWTLSALWYSKVRPSQHNIKVCTQWGISGTEFQEEQYGFGTWKNGRPMRPIEDWLEGFKKIYLLPLVLFGWGFWSGLTWGKTDPQKFN